jgi:hypothetical protein
VTTENDIAVLEEVQMDTMMPVVAGGFRAVIDDICDLNWSGLRQSEITGAAWAYYYFSIQFRENLEIAYQMHPADKLLRQLYDGECNTDNLSPWPDVVQPGEKVNHDEFMRRTLALTPIDQANRLRIEVIGRDYLTKMRAQDDLARAMSISSFEDGGLERVFTAMLTCQCWDTPLLASFRHFLVKHIEFDSDPDEGHGALARHLAPDERVHPLWNGFYSLFVQSVPYLKERP